MPKPRYFVVVSHCLFNPATRVHILGRSFTLARKISHYFLSKNIGIIQLPCPEFTAMGYWRNPQGRQQYENIFFRKHCRKELESIVDMICELKNNSNTPLCYIGIQGSPTCSIYWGKHKTNKYHTESINADESDTTGSSVLGVMTSVLDEMLHEQGVKIPYLEAPIKENIQSDKVIEFFALLDNILDIPPQYAYDPLNPISPQNENGDEH